MKHFVTATLRPTLTTALLISILAPTLKAQLLWQETVGYTTYDYAFDTGSPTRIVSYNGQLHLMYVKRDSAASLPRLAYVGRYQNYWSSPSIIVPSVTQGSTSGSLDVWRGGSLDDVTLASVGMSADSEDFFATEFGPGQGSFFVQNIGHAGGPHILFLQDSKSIIIGDIQDGDYRILASTDSGATFTTMNSGVLASSHLIGGQRAHGNPVLISIPGAIILGTTLAGNGPIAPLGSSAPDSADLFGYFKSADTGRTWTWTTIAKEGAEIFPDHFYLPKEVSQYDFVADDSGKIRCAFNGYNLFRYASQPDSFRASTDVVSWESLSGFVSLVSFDRTLPIIDDVIRHQSGRAKGCSYPSLATTADGSVVYCAWSQPNFTASSIDTGTNGHMMYDLYLSDWNWGYWGWPRPLTQTTDRSELFGTLAPRLDGTGSGSSPIGRILYIADETDGCSVFGQGAPNVEPIVYYQFLTWIDLAVRVDDRIPESFRLEQNYPNPFNPSTTIEFSIPGPGRWFAVSVKIYDLLGREVTTVVYKNMQPGHYRKEWSTGRLASGVYFCVMRAHSLDVAGKKPFLGIRKLLVIK